MASKSYDVIVVGGGNAALCAALQANEKGAKVLMLERSPKDKRGGNSAFTTGSFRMVHHGLPDIQKVIPDLSPEEIATTDFGEYSAEEYLDDLGRITQYNIDPDLAETLVKNSTDTVQWLKNTTNMRFVPLYGRYAFKHEGRFKFFGGSVCVPIGGGLGLVDQEYKTVEKKGIDVLYNAQATTLIRGAKGIEGVRARVEGEEQQFSATSVVLACGGFEANREWCTRYLGPGWDMAKVRGSRYNTGDGLRMALEIGAQPYGQWSGCHAVSWERYATDYGQIEAPSNPYRHSYPFSIMINSEGQRFVDEGFDFRNYTYAKYGRVVLAQPGNFAWQVFDAQVAHLIRDEYRSRGATKVTADTLEELVKKMQDVNADQFLATVREYNAAIRKDIPFDPNVKDGRTTEGLPFNKTNWAMTIEKPPFIAYSVGCGVTFTFGGVKVDTATHVLDVDDLPIPGLYASGEMIGGIFYFNYPGGSGLMSGAVFGRISGREAAAFAGFK